MGNACARRQSQPQGKPKSRLLKSATLHTPGEERENLFQDAASEALPTEATASQVAPPAGDDSRPSDVEQRSAAHLQCCRSLARSGDTVAIELVLKVAKDLLASPEDAKLRSLKLAVLQRRLEAGSADAAERAIAALESAGFQRSHPVGEQSVRLEFPPDTCDRPLRELVRMLDRTRGTFWTPTALKEDAPEPAPDSWQVRLYPEIGGIVIKESEAEIWSQTFRRTGNEGRSWRGRMTPRITITFMNLSEAERLVLRWIDNRSLTPQESAEHTSYLDPGKHLEQYTFVHHAWVIRLPDGTAIGGYIPTDQGPGSHHFVAIGRCRKMPTPERFEQLARDHIEALHEQSDSWRDTVKLDEERDKGGPPPPRPEGERWAVVAWPPLCGTQVSERDAEPWAATCRSVEQHQRLELCFVNCSDEGVTVHWLDAKSGMRERWTDDIGPGKSIGQQTCLSHAFVLRDQLRRAVGGYVPTDIAVSAKHVIFFGPPGSLPSAEDLLQRASPYLAT
eukprot:TRINITY_DN78241_c0_g1_i1.p1 TRINITY_DN78241_c0_g1~~TRINITY_DN78241_c0_g1_i1.p1  ORF type:complete len:506 (+),score=103.02 TRINITY_DN78241_c0_g1_i1:37-1554(+)